MSDKYDPQELAGVTQNIKRQEGDECMLPDFAKGYKAFGRASVKPLYTLHCFLGKEGFRSFQFVHMDSDSTLTTERDGQVITLRFAGLKPVIVMIRGTNLRLLYDYIHQHRMPWIAQADRDFPRGDEPMISRILITPYEEPKVAKLNEALGSGPSAKP